MSRVEFRPWNYFFSFGLTFSGLHEVSFRPILLSNSSLISRIWSLRCRNDPLAFCPRTFRTLKGTGPSGEHAKENIHASGKNICTTCSIVPYTCDVVMETSFLTFPYNSHIYTPVKLLAMLYSFIFVMCHFREMSYFSRCIVTIFIVLCSREKIF